MQIHRVRAGWGGVGGGGGGRKQTRARRKADGVVNFCYFSANKDVRT